MKIVLMSDTHFGFGHGRERWEDSFLAFEEGIEAAKEADLVLLGGDIFDNRIPTQETFSRVMSILLKTRQYTSEVKIAGGSKKSGHQGFPIVSIHGNHERRVQGLVNPVEALEKGGFLIHLHCNSLILQKGEERVAIHGMSAVPDQYVTGVLEEWNPKPIPGCYNILLFHQNLEGFLYTNNPLPHDSVPKGFDLYICGDIHEACQSSLHGSPLLLPGSTVATQIKKEATTPRSFSLIDTEKKDFQQIPFKNQRKVFYEEFQTPEDAKSFIKNVLSQEHSLKPIIRIKASFPKEELPAPEKAILMITHEKETPSISLEEHKLSVRETGKALLEANLKKASLDPKIFEQVFELLLNKNREEALNLLKKSSQK